MAGSLLLSAVCASEFVGHKMFFPHVRVFVCVCVCVYGCAHMHVFVCALLQLAEGRVTGGCALDTVSMVTPSPVR